MQTMKSTSALRATRPAHVSRTRTARCSRPTLVVRADQKSGISQFSDSIGLPTDEGIFGFKPFSEVWCGRLAMMGFISSIVVEFQTGKGTLQQIGLEPSMDLFTVMASVVLGATVVGTAVTAYKGFSGKMTSQEAQRYKEFLLLQNEESLIAASRKEGSVADTFFSPSSEEAIAEVRRDGMAADKLLGANTDADVVAARAQGTPADAVLSVTSSSTESPAASSSKPAPQTPTYDDKWFGNSEMRYARDVELANGRSAMVGFLAAVLVEAATGKGILLQLIMWGKITGLLGYESGF